MKKFKNCETSIPIYETVTNALIEYFDCLKNYKLSVFQTFTPIIRDFNEYLMELKNLDKKIKEKSKYILQMKTAYEPLLSIVNSENNGLLRQLESKFIKEDLLSLNNSFCYTLLDGFFFEFLFFLILSILQLILGLLVCFGVIRVLPKDEETKILLETTSQNEVRRLSLLF